MLNATCYHALNPDKAVANPPLDIEKIFRYKLDVVYLNSVINQEKEKSISQDLRL